MTSINPVQPPDPAATCSPPSYGSSTSPAWAHRSRRCRRPPKNQKPTRSSQVTFALFRTTARDHTEIDYPRRRVGWTEVLAQGYYHCTSATVAETDPLLRTARRTGHRNPFPNAVRISMNCVATHSPSNRA